MSLHTLPPRQRFSAAPELTEMRARYVEILEGCEFGTAEEARQVLEAPLCEEWFSVYAQASPYRPSCEIVDDRVASFLHEYATQEEARSIDRVIAGFNVSLERLSLQKLVARHFQGRQSDQTDPRTQKLLKQMFFSFSEGLSKKERYALNSAAAKVLGWDRETLPDLVKRLADESPSFAADLNGFGQKTPYLLRQALSVLRQVAKPDEEPAIRRILRGGPTLGREAVETPLTLARRAQAEMSDAERSRMAAQLTRFLRSARAELEGQILAELDGELMRRIEIHIYPLEFTAKPRRRYSAGARYRRRDLGFKTDLGHFIPHSAGGPADINLFHQDPALNRGRSEPGKAYRTMETYLGATPDLFHFTRAIYRDRTAIPKWLEVGILLSEAQASEIEPLLPTYGGYYLCRSSALKDTARWAWWIGLFDNQPGAESGGRDAETIPI